MKRALVWVGLFLALSCFVSACEVARDALTSPKQRARPSGPRLRYEALGHHLGEVRMVHPSGREAWGPRVNVPQMLASGWRLAPE